MTRERRTSPQTTAVLETLADRGGQWSHGYDLCDRLGLKAGTVYPILMRLADRGQVEATWEDEAPSGRPPRHLYRLSSSGAELVARLRAEDRSAEAQRIRGSATGTATAPVAGPVTA